MAEIFVTDIERGYRELFVNFDRFGEETSPRGQKTVEIPHVRLVHVDPTDVLLLGTGRNMSPRLAALEALQLVGGFTDPELTVHVTPHYAQFMDDGKFHGAYGARTALKIGLVLDRLKMDPDTRRAVVQFWDDRLDLTHEGLRDYPCTLSTTFHIRRGCLDMATVMRSNDAWLGYPYDVVQFTTLQRAMARFLNVPVGWYSHTAQSMHAYERDFPAIQRMMKSDPKTSTATRIKLIGGITVGESYAKTFTGEVPWLAVQKRAREICYFPESITPETDEEAWLIEQSKSWQAFLHGRSYVTQGMR